MLMLSIFVLDRLRWPTARVTVSTNLLKFVTSLAQPVSLSARVDWRRHAYALRSRTRTCVLSGEGCTRMVLRPWASIALACEFDMGFRKDSSNSAISGTNVSSERAWTPHLKSPTSYRNSFDNKGGQCVVRMPQCLVNRPRSHPSEEPVRKTDGGH